MRKVLSIVVIAGFVAAASVTALAKPESLVKGILKFYQKNPGRVLEIKRDGKRAHNMATVIVLEGGKIKAYEFPEKGGREEVKPLRTYDLEKVKALKMTALRAHNIVMNEPSLKSKHPIIRAVTLHEMEDGTLQYYVHRFLSSGAGAYGGAWAIDPKTRKMGSDVIKGKNPLDEKWSEPLSAELTDDSSEKDDSSEEKEEEDAPEE